MRVSLFSTHRTGTVAHHFELLLAQASYVPALLDHHDGFNTVVSLRRFIPASLTIDNLGPL
jgi:hypothetical protein